MICLREPSLDQYWYEKKLLESPLTMEYNAGWDVSYEGYDYHTGCISFPEEKWIYDFEKRKRRDRFFAYIVHEENEFVGYVNFHYNPQSNKYECGVVIEHCHRGKGYGKRALQLLCDVAFHEYKVDALYDCFEENREAIKIFESLGFKKVSEFDSKRFGKFIKIIEVCLQNRKGGDPDEI